MTEQMNVPKLRFSEFEGEWKSFPLMSLLSKVIDYRGQSVPKAETGIPLITAKNVKKGYLDFSSAEYVDEVEFEAWATRGKPRGGDVLFTTEAPLGNVCFFPSDRTYAVGQRTVTLVGSEKLDNSYLLHLMLSPKMQQSIDAKSSGSTAKGIKSSELKKLPVTVSTVPSEQQKIASFLSKVDEKISLLTEKKDKLTEYKKGVMQKLFSGKWQEQDGLLTFIPPTLRFKADDGSEFPDWEEKKLGDVLIKYRLGGNYQNSEVRTQHPLIKMGNLGRGNINLNKIEYISDSEVIDPQDRIQEGDLFFNTRNTLELVGKVAIWKCELPEAYYNSNLMRLEFDNNSFMNYCLNSFNGVKGLRRFATGTTSVAAIYTRDLLKLKLSIPSLEEQIKIANFLSAIDLKIDFAQSEIQKAKEWKKGLLQQMFV